MSFRNVRILLRREIIDQLRDRRMLLLMFVLPVLLYPFLGLCFLQVSQFTRETPSRILVAFSMDEAEFISRNADFPVPLLQEDLQRFNPALFSEKSKANLLLLTMQKTAGQNGIELANAELNSKSFDAVLVFSTLDFLGKDNQNTQDNKADPVIIYTTAQEKSVIAQSRLEQVLNRWNRQLGTKRLEDAGLAENFASPLSFSSSDIAEKTQFQGASLWSKILPIMLILWALTGAFYPAIDLCAGEKERGTLETLLCSPTKRSEIVFGKLLTVMIFSMMTSILNVLGIGVTGGLMLSQMPYFSSPPPSAVIWLLLALLPIAALFGSLSIALAAFAKSSKEGQYYLTPLMLIVMPLALIPMSPGVELTLGNAMIPITGIILLLGQCLEGDYLLALRYSPIVVLVSLFCCFLSIRWAISQFNSESVLFRESERFTIQGWIRHTLAHKEALPTAVMGLGCAAVILSLKYFASFILPQGNDFETFFASTASLQIFAVLAPPVVMAFVLTTDPIGTLKLRRPHSWWTIPLAFLLAIALHPALVWLANGIGQLYPLSPEVEQAIEKQFESLTDVPILHILLIVAVFPAICEEAAFRGFMLSGLQRKGNWQAIFITAAIFGFTHSILQQSLTAACTGCLLGYLAVRTGSLFTCIAYHFANNAFASVAGMLWLNEMEKHKVGYPMYITIPGIILAVIILAVINRLTGKREKGKLLFYYIKKAM